MEVGFDNMFAVMMHIAKEGTRPAAPAKTSAEGCGFLARCFVRDPRRRATAAELLEDAWLAVDIAVDL